MGKVTKYVSNTSYVYMSRILQALREKLKKNLLPT